MCFYSCQLMNKKKILVTATTFPRWKNDSEPSFVYALSSTLEKKGYKTVVLAPHYYKAKIFEVMGNLKVYRFPYFYPLRFQRLCYEGGILENLKKSFLAKIQMPFLLLSEYFHTIKIIKKEKIDFIHAHWIVPQGFIAALIKKLYKIPFISTAHAGDVFPLKKGMIKNLARFAIKNSSYVTANSSFTKSSILRLMNVKNIEVVPMGVDLKNFNAKNKDNKLRTKYNIKNEFILFVGRLAEKKGVEYLIRAIPLVLEKLPNSKLLIVGDGPEKEKLTNLTKKLNLEEYVIFVGKLRLEDLPKFYATADVFVGPSIVTEKGDTEGLGIVFLEAIASGTCVIGSNVGGIPDIIKHNKTGLLVEQKNPKQLAHSIVSLLKNKKLQKKLNKNAIRHISTYSWDIIASKFEKIYDKIK